MREFKTVKAGCWGESVSKVEKALRSEGITLCGVENMRIATVVEETDVGICKLEPGQYCELTFKVLVKVG